MLKIGRVLSVGVAVAAFSACNLLSSLVHDEAVAARVGRHRLYQTDLSAAIPKGVSGMDSTNLSIQFINSWATEMLFLDEAESQLSKDDRDVSDELEAYRRSLLRFRYEQLFISDRLDTVVTEEQKCEFYSSHKDLFRLERPILKVRFISIAKNHPRRSYIIRKMASSKPGDIMEVDSLAFTCAVKYFDKSEEWTDASVLASEFNLDQKQMMSHYVWPYITVEDPAEPDVKVAVVLDIQRQGTAPMDFCDSKIREYILSGRKHDLLMGLERDLLQQALDRGSFEIY